MAIDIKQASRRLLEEAYGKGNLEVFDEICDPGYSGHDPVTGDTDLKHAKENCRMYRTAFPDLSCTIVACYAERDTVFTHWRMTGTHEKPLMGIPATGKRCTVEGMSLTRFRGGKLAEDWVQWDALGLMRQLGAWTSQQAGTSTTRRTEQTHPRH
jgi:steroid delta-isomerase-like uncharacterized protein